MSITVCIGLLQLIISVYHLRKTLRVLTGDMYVNWLANSSLLNLMFLYHANAHPTHNTSMGMNMKGLNDERCKCLNTIKQRFTIISAGLWFLYGFNVIANLYKGYVVVDLECLWAILHTCTSLANYFNIKNLQMKVHMVRWITKISSRAQLIK